MKILVTGCGGEIGLGIGRILQKENMTSSIIGCDIHEDHAGTFVFNRVEIISRADSDAYLNSINCLIKKYNIDVVIPTSEPELRVLANNELYKKVASKIVMANPQALEVGFDKLATAEMLKINNLPYPWTMPVKEGNPKELPCIIKDRFGSGSKNVSVVEKDMLGYYSIHRQQDIWQEYLTPEDQEFTCGLFRSASGEIRTITFRRVLRGGHTVSGEVVENNDIDDLLISIANVIQLIGSINVQLRLANNKPVVFEINPRFSSTVVFRHILGFKDLVWCLEDKDIKPISKYIPPTHGTRFYRGDTEYIKPPYSDKAEVDYV